MGLVSVLGTLGARRYLQTKATHQQQTQQQRAVQDAQRQAGKLLADITAHPQDIETRWRFVDFCRQHQLDEQANHQLRVIASLDEKNSRAALVLARFYLEHREYAQAEMGYREIRRRWPKEVEAWQGLASAQYHLRRYLEASETATHAVKLAPSDPSSNLILASALLEYALQFPNPSAYAAELAHARDIFLGLLRLSPNNGELYYRLSRAWGGLHDHKEELENLRHAYALLPDRAVIASHLLRTALEASDLATAEKVGAEALQKHPDDASLHSLMGHYWEAKGGPEKVLAEYQAAVRCAPNNANYQANLATSYLRLNRLPEARTAFERVASLTPNAPFPFQQLAVVYNRLGEPAKARTAARMAAGLTYNDQQQRRIQSLSEQHPDDPTLHLILADRYRDLKLYAASRDQYLMVLKQDLQNQRAKTGLVELTKAAEQQSRQDLPAPAELPVGTEPLPSPTK